MAKENEINNLLGPPKLVNTTGGHPLSVGNVTSGKVQVYWGPGPPHINDLEYVPPDSWPREGLVYRRLHVCRVVWESSDLDATAFAASGFAGSYQYTIFTDHSYLDITTPPGIFPVHKHDEWKYPLGIPGGITVYGVQYPVTLEGHLEVFNGAFDAKGDDLNTYIEHNTPEFSLLDYHTPGSDIAKVIQFIADVTGDATAVDDIFPGAPPIHITSDFHPGGVAVIKTGNYSVDGEVNNDGSNLSWPPTAITIPVGYTPPSATDATHRDEDLNHGFQRIKKKLRDAKRTTYPYYSVSHIYDPFSGINEPPIAQFYVSQHAHDWLPTNILNILVICKPHVPFNPSDYEVSVANWKYFKLYKTVVYVDDKYMNDCQLPSGVVESAVAQWQEFCAALNEFGWLFGGRTTGGLLYHGANMEEETINAINKWFPMDSPDTPPTFDPPIPIGIDEPLTLG